ncbi:cupredoxin domain-containing protein [Paenibacillus sp. ACRRX]|uniref:cupredoxin domain-containing protein n=1 Tax=unclassified Paenibacillus TaxID=185978 RepID=UPI001EF4F8A8|nr:MULTISPECIES: cupredoxin domain-containing protein [unclassified Paenibacillus]MCG7409864.1 cupredoxin domain-containing protein [Paenibacillus sp. ACRRX]MDK8183069.1 cupredoxin domain-containing protein [Paenibacillus sp. UMB4589-SE434]
MKRPIALAAAMLALAYVMVACGSNQQGSAGQGSGEPASAAKEIIIKATNYKFDQPEYRVKAGETVKFVLESSGNHGIRIQDIGLELTPNQTSQVVTPAETGTYEFKCTIMCGPGHKEMTAKLIVE